MAAWDNDPIVTPAKPAASSGQPWEADEIVTKATAGEDNIAALKRHAAQHGLPGYGPGAFLRSTVNAVPIAGPALTDLFDTVQAFSTSVRNGVPLDQAKQETTFWNDAAQRGAPVESAAGTAFGTIAPLAVASIPAAGARLLGVSGNIGSRVVLGGGSAAAISGTDAWARGGNPDEVRQQILVGGALGAGAPVVERFAGMILKAVTGKALDPAETALARAIQDDGIPLDQLQRRIDELGPEAVLADLGPNLQRQAGALASMPGPAQKLVRQALMDRAAGTNARIIGDTNDILGPAPIPSRVTREIGGNMDALRPQYETVFRDKAMSADFEFDPAIVGNAVDTALAGAVGTTARRLSAVRDMLLDPASGEFTRDPGRVFAVRQELDGMIAAETNPTVQGRLVELRRTLDGDLGAQVPGLKQTDARYEELARQRDAVGEGQQLLDSGRTAVRPDELRDRLGQVPERGMGPSAAPFRLLQGARAEIERIIGTTANDLNALKTALKGDGSWNRERLALLFGRQKADRLLQILEREQTFARTHDVVTRNSETAARQAAQAEVNSGSPQMMRDLTLTGVVASGAQKLANVGARTRRGATNEEIARVLMSQRVNPRTMSAVEQAIAERLKNAWIAPAAVPLLAQ